MSNLQRQGQSAGLHAQQLPEVQRLSALSDDGHVALALLELVPPAGMLMHRLGAAVLVVVAAAAAAAVVVVVVVVGSSSSSSSTITIYYYY